MRPPEGEGPTRQAASRTDAPACVTWIAEGIARDLDAVAGIAPAGIDADAPARVNGMCPAGMEKAGRAMFPRA
jgi:hypothetical protein